MNTNFFSVTALTDTWKHNSNTKPLEWKFFIWNHGRVIYSSTEQCPAIFADIQTKDYEGFKAALSHTGRV